MLSNLEGLLPNKGCTGNQWSWHLGLYRFLGWALPPSAVPIPRCPSAARVAQASYGHSTWGCTGFWDGPCHPVLFHFQGATLQQGLHSPAMAIAPGAVQGSGMGLATQCCSNSKVPLCSKGCTGQPWPQHLWLYRVLGCSLPPSAVPIPRCHSAARNAQASYGHSTWGYTEFWDGPCQPVLFQIPRCHSAARVAQASYGHSTSGYTEFWDGPCQPVLFPFQGATLQQGLHRPAMAIAPQAIQNSGIGLASQCCSHSKVPLCSKECTGQPWP